MFNGRTMEPTQTLLAQIRRWKQCLVNDSKPLTQKGLSDPLRQRDRIPLKRARPCPQLLVQQG